MILLTKDNYYTLKNTAISSSKVRVFLKSKELFFKRYIEGSASDDDTTSIQLGRIVDKIITQGNLYQFHRTYRLAVKKRDDAETFAKLKEMDDRRILTPSIYWPAVEISEKILHSPFFQFYKIRQRGHQSMKQIILQYRYPVTGEPAFDVCGMLDRLTISGNTAFIDDLKTSSSAGMKNATSWLWHCQEWNYLMQLAVYKWLVEQNYPEIENVVCRHIVAGTSKADLYPVKLYVIPPTLLKAPLQLFFETAQAITDEQEFKDVLPGWDDAEMLPELMDVPNEGAEVVSDEVMNNL